MLTSSRGETIRDCTHTTRHHHGTRRMYMADRCKCGPCRAACARYEATRYRNRILGLHKPQHLDPTGAARRLQALAWLGWSTADLAARTGLQAEHLGRIRGEDRRFVRISTHQVIAAVYEQLWDQYPPQREGKASSAPIRTRLHARSRGWLPPLAWDDIDLDVVAPNIDGGAPVDDVAVELVCSGIQVPLTREERVEVARRLHRRGLTDRQIGERLGMTPSGAQRLRARNNVTKAAA